MKIKIASSEYARLAPLLVNVQILVMFCANPAFCLEQTAREKASAEEIKSARDFMKGHRLSQANTLLTPLVEKYPDDAELAMVHASLLRELGQFGLASKEFARAALLAPTDPFPLIALSQLSVKQMEWEPSLNYAHQAITRNPACLPARLELIDVLLQCGQTSDAERQLRNIPAYEKNIPAVEQLAYRLSLKKGDLTAARSHLHKAIEGSADSLQLRLEQSDLMQTMGANNTARTELEKVLAADPDILSARLRLARLLETQNHDYAGALSNYNEALRIDPLSAQAIAGYERCQLKRRNIALQIKMALREFWTQLVADDSKSSVQQP